MISMLIIIRLKSNSCEASECTCDLQLVETARPVSTYWRFCSSVHLGQIFSRLFCQFTGNTGVMQGGAFSQSRVWLEKISVLLLKVLPAFWQATALCTLVNLGNRYSNASSSHLQVFVAFPLARLYVLKKPKMQNS